VGASGRHPAPGDQQQTAAEVTVALGPVDKASDQSVLSPGLVFAVTLFPDVRCAGVVLSPVASRAWNV